VTGTRHDVLLQISGSDYRLVCDTDVVTEREVSAITNGFETAITHIQKAMLSHA
jgi:hypothetical protein